MGGSGATGLFLNDTSNGGCGSAGWCTRQGIAKHFMIASLTDVYLPDMGADDDNRMYEIIFKRNGPISSPQYFYIVAKGDDWLGMYPSPEHYNPASDDFITHDG